jgi:hypothetical protein
MILASQVKKNRVWPQTFAMELALMKWRTGVSPSCHRRVTGVSPACHRRVTGVSPACHRRVTGVSPACHQRVTGVSPACHRRVTGVSPACHRRVTSVSPACHRSVTGVSTGNHVSCYLAAQMFATTRYLLFWATETIFVTIYIYIQPLGGRRGLEQPLKRPLLFSGITSKGLPNIIFIIQSLYCVFIAAKSLLLLWSQLKKSLRPVFLYDCQTFERHLSL